ncbi:MAG: DUF975 family protein [Faecalicatena sp.]|uniref:DUF975 family protein n=1 Tax=Faecalicatena sp. TaxID=2005360 RepID=UPI0025861536|nr:DUF975 family protein [Faecalicatena sp.]MCI6466601.1 DUF975 family protein [Faecalicatena sp.]MDY5617976.1 DUF975 family protein [Lachnospiraceae bacterium]
MWKRKVLKKKTRQALKFNYWRMVAVCFLTAMLTTAYTSSTIFINLYEPDHTSSPAPDVSTGASNSEIIADTVEQISDEPVQVFDSPAGSALDLLINTYTSGKSVFFSILRALNNILAHTFELSSVFLMAGVLLAFLYQFLIENMIVIGERRFFLEARNYHQTRISKIFFLFKLRFIRNPVWIMLCRSIYQFLWDLTIVGGIIKHYEYSMIPFILAENPSISRSDAFHLSKQLMHGNKWRMFLLHLSFFGWHLLSLFTLGILDFLFVNPYMAGTDAELYMELRRNYVLSRSPGYEAFNDRLLEQVPSEDELLISKALYDDSEGPYTKISYFAPEQYPVFLYSIQPPERAVKAPIHADKKYGFLSCVFLFFAFSIFGWIFESLVHLIRDGVFLNRGFLIGPWIPLYGLCGLILLIVVQKFVHKPIPAFIMMMAIYSVIEYLLNWFLEYEWDIVQTDYTGYLLNLNGKTFIGGAIFFGLLGCAFLYYLAPKWDDLFHGLPEYIQILLCVLLCTLFAADFVYALTHPELLSELFKPGFLFTKV